MERLRDAGAVIVAKTNMHEVALGVTGENPWTGDVLNPLEAARQAGGSSSGSGAAVAAGIGLASLGTDTGGSIRIPAALCGVVGFKGTHGLVPLDGALALSPTCDHAGPLARTVEDARTVFEVLSGRPLAAPGPGSLRFAVPCDYLDGWLSPGVREVFASLLAGLARSAHSLSDASIPELELTAEAYTPLVRAEAAFVHRAALAAGGEGFSPATLASLEAGAALTAGEYLLSRDRRARVIAGLDAALSQVDALLLPATPVVAPPRGTTEVDVEQGRVPHRAAFLRLTSPFSLAGVPVACLPIGQLDGLPVGLQVVGRRGEDARVLAVAEAIEGIVRGGSAT